MSPGGTLRPDGEETLETRYFARDVPATTSRCDAQVMLYLDAAWARDVDGALPDADLAPAVGLTTRLQRGAGGLVDTSLRSTRSTCGSDHEPVTR